MELTTDEAEASLMQHWDAITTVVGSVFSTSCNTTIDIDDSGQADVTDDQTMMVAIISFAGDIEWSIFSAYPQDAATAVASRFAGFDIPHDSPDMADAIGEIANIVAGGIKMMLNERGTNVDISLPTVISSTGLETRALQGASSRTECFKCDRGRFWTGVFLGDAG